ncbi:MAG: ribose 1,5-bisphosphate isomerase [Candidatus Bathyarchaeia archaeon]
MHSTGIPREAKQIAEDIRDMKIRGAGELARAAVRALMIACERSSAKNAHDFLDDLRIAARALLETRPTAVSLPNGIRYVMHRVNQASRTIQDVEQLRSVGIKAAEEFIANSNTAIERIGEIGARRIKDGDVLLTHCNSSAAISVIKTAWQMGKRIHVYATETRPRFQGRITAGILLEAGIPVTMIVDSAARYFMKDIDKVIVGADAVSANGAVVNKIGTSMIALAAKESNVRMFVAAETYKFSPETMIGEVVAIEERSTDEVIGTAELRKLPNVEVKNPSFDVTPAEYIDLIITEKGITPPQGAMLVLQEVMGAITPEELEEYKTFTLAEVD